MSQAPLFFHGAALTEGTRVNLADDTARHVIQVLRMQCGERLELTNGQGYRAEAEITEVSKKACSVHIHTNHFYERRNPVLHLGVAFTKNTARNEWILEKVTELGVATIITLQAARSEREKFRYDRWRNILVSAMLQSQQYYLPVLESTKSLTDIYSTYSTAEQKLVAHCIGDFARTPLHRALKKGKETLLLIGPEGDFTLEEVNELTSNGFEGISMGANRLRTETAAVAACAWFNMLNND